MTVSWRRLRRATPYIAGTKTLQKIHAVTGLGANLVFLAEWLFAASAINCLFGVAMAKLIT